MKLHYLYVVCVTWCCALSSLFSPCHAHARNNMAPTNYNLSISLDIGNSSYNGSVLIGFQVFQKVDVIKLNSEGLHVESVVVQANIWPSSPPVTLASDWKTDSDRLVIDLKGSELPSNITGILSVTFRNTLERNHMGMFKGKCNSPNESWIVSTLMEPVYASNVFPCFDVVSPKTPFTLNMTINSNLEIMSSLQRRPGVFFDATRSKKTIIFSSRSVTPLGLGWIIYDPQVMKKNPSGVFVCQNNIFKLDSIKQSSILLENMINTNSTNVVGQVFLLPDFTEDFAQFPGLNFIREEFASVEDMSYIDKANSLLTQASIASGQVIGGDVTFPTWSELWFFKGFNHLFKYNASFMLSDSKDVNDSLRMLYLRDLQDAFEGNRLQKTRPLSDHAHSHRRIKSLYDSSSFSKAGVMFKMIEDLMGYVSFYRMMSSLAEDAMQNYNGTLESQNIFYALNTYYPRNDLPRNVRFAEIVNNWVYEPGYPVLNVIRKKNTIEIKQKNIIPDTSKHFWVPIKLQVSEDFILETNWLKPGDILTLSLPSESKWYLLNADLNGLYRINYDLDNWVLLSESYFKFSEEVRAKLLEDALGLAKDNLLPYQVAMRFTRRLANESSLLPWSAVLPHFSYIRWSLSGLERTAWEDYVTSLVMGVKNSSALNSSSIKMKFIDIFCLNKFKCHNISSMLLNENDILNAKRDWVASQVCADVEGNNTNWDMYLGEYQNKRSPSSEQRILFGLACSPNETTTRRFLQQFTLLNSPVKRQDFVKVCTGLAWSEEGSGVVLKWLTNRSNFVTQYISGNSKVITDIVNEISKKLFNLSAAIDIRRLFVSTATNTDGFLEQRALERIRTNSIHRRHLSPVITTWLINRDNPSADEVTSSAIKTHPFWLLFAAVQVLFYLCN